MRRTSAAGLLAVLATIGCGGKVDLREAPIEVCSRVNLLAARAAIADARRLRAHFPDVRESVAKAEELYREGEWAQQRGECEISSRRGLEAEAEAKSAAGLHDRLAAALPPDVALAKAQADLAAAERAVDARLVPKAAKNLAAARGLISEAVEAAGEGRREKAREGSLRAVAAWRLFDLTLEGRVDSEMARAKIVLEEAEKALAAAAAAGLREGDPGRFSQAELWIKVARFDVEENDPPEVAEFALKALSVLDEARRKKDGDSAPAVESGR